MNKTIKLIGAALILTAAGCAAFLLFRPSQQSGRVVARITVNGTIVNEINLSGVEEPYSFTLEGPGGFSNTVLVEPGRICVSQAGCPDQVCVNQGFISNGITPIVCLPNKLIIEISGGGEGLDAATG